MSVEDAIHALRALASGRGGAVPGRDRQGPVRQSARRLRPLRRYGREAPRGARLHGRAAQGPRGARQGQRHGLGDQPDRAQAIRAGRPDRSPSTPTATWCRRAPAGRATLTGPRSLTDGWYGRGVAVSKSDIATYAFAILALEKSGAALNGTVELHVTYDEEAGGEIGPRLYPRAGPVEAGSGDRRRLLLRRRQRPQRLPASRGRGSRPLGARRPALHRSRRARGGRPRS